MTTVRNCDANCYYNIDSSYCSAGDIEINKTGCCETFVDRDSNLAKEWLKREKQI